jgi:molecular chaperone DnaK (HSP70)
MEYNFTNIGNEQFENLIQALMQKILGYDSIVFGKGPDGGRELTFEGKSNFPNAHKNWDGYWIVQAKYKSREEVPKNSFTWVKKHLIKEIKGFQTKKRKLPDNYIFITNAILTASAETGDRDKIQKLITEYNNLIRNILVIGYDELCKLIDNNLDVRSAYTHLITHGDMLYKVLALIEKNEHNVVLDGQEIRELNSESQKNYAYITKETLNRLISIDFGSSTSLVAYLNDKNEITFIESDKKQKLIPTCITFFRNGTYVIGRPEYKKISDAITIGNFKRELGKNKTYLVFDKKYTAEDLTVLFLKSLKQNIADHFGSNTCQIMVSKPTYFGIKQTNALIQSFQNAGFSVKRFISESSASSLNYTDSRLKNISEDCCYLSIDLGGGTLDIDVIEYGDNIFEIKESYGNNYLGGFDYDHLVFAYCKKEIQARGILLTDLLERQLYYDCERVKIGLKDAESVNVILRDVESPEGNYENINLCIDRQKFRNIVSSLDLKIFNILNAISRQYKITSILLCGQGSKIFTVDEVIKYLFSGIPVIDLFVENAVIRGLSKSMGVIEGKIKNILLLDTIKEMIAIKCLKPIKKEILVLNKVKHQYETKVYEGTISTNMDDNLLFSNLIDSRTTIPLKQDNEFQILNNSGLKHSWIEFYEFEKSSCEYSYLGKFPLFNLAKKRNLKLTIYIDANSTIIIHLASDDNSKPDKIIINNFHLSEPFYARLE